MAEPGKAEVYRTLAEQSGTATELRLFVANFSTASALELGLYADASGVPTTLLGLGRIEQPGPRPPGTRSTSTSRASRPDRRTGSAS